MFVKYSEAKIIDTNLDLEKVSKFIDKIDKLEKFTDKNKKIVKSEK